MTKDLQAYRYYTATNNVAAVRGGRGFLQDHPDAMVPGVVSGFACCCYDLHMGWPMLVQHAWKATADGGLAATIYAPTDVRATLPGAGAVGIAERTHYPFDGDVHLTLSLERPATFPLQLRVPGWCDHATCAINGQPQPSPTAGTLVVLNRRWADGDRVDLSFPMPLTTLPSVNDAVSLARGPLVFSLAMRQDRRPDPPAATPDANGFVPAELTSPDAWNVAPAIDPADAAATVTVHTRPMPAGIPFEPDATPVTLSARGRPVPGWGMDWTGRSAQDPPPSPVASSEAERALTLVPFGAQTLRITAFPWLGPDRPPRRTSYRADFHGPDAQQDWVDYGSGWYVEDGARHVAPTGKAHGFGTTGLKSVVGTTDFADLVYDADVSPATAGDTGLIFRVTHPAIGPHAFDGYYAGVDPGAGRVVLGKATAATNAWTRLADGPVTGVRAGGSVHLRVIAVGPALSIYVGDMSRPAVTATDDAHARGAIGVRQYLSGTDDHRAGFANLMVTVPGRDQR